MLFDSQTLILARIYYKKTSRTQKLKNFINGSRNLPLKSRRGFAQCYAWRARCFSHRDYIEFRTLKKKKNKFLSAFPSTVSDTKAGPEHIFMLRYLKSFSLRREECKHVCLAYTHKRPPRQATHKSLDFQQMHQLTSTTFFQHCIRKTVSSSVVK